MDQTGNSYFKRVIGEMLQHIEGAARSLKQWKTHPRVFNPVFISMIKAGEKGGVLKEILDRIVEMQEKRQALITALRSA